jgi:hypothetical protein
MILAPTQTNSKDLSLKIKIPRAEEFFKNFLVQAMVGITWIPM